MQSAVKVIQIFCFGVVGMSAHFKFTATVGTYKKARKWVYKSRPCFSALRYRLHSVVDFIPQFLRYNRFVIVVSY